MLKVFNTESKKKENFVPLEKNFVRFYQCGPTLYWTQHIGNLRAAVMADLILKSLLYLGYKVKFVRNFTDVGHLSGDNLGDADSGEDRMEKASRRENLSPEKIAEKYKKIYLADIKKLNTKLPDKMPEATKHIKEMQKFVEILLKKDFAYSTPLAIYFDVSKAKNYNRLSGQKKSENKISAGKGEISDPNKKNPEDFALWFFKAGTHKNALQTWSSPFFSPLTKNGEGFPGWHLECSAMSKALLGKTLDLKMGGVEHIPIHHTNEIAQSESANDAPYVKYWLHNEHLLVNGKKMSKSEGTSYTLEDIEKKGFSPMDLRYFFLQAHYRSKQNFTWEALMASKKAREKLIKKITSLGKDGKIDLTFKKKFEEKISDDFSIPEALALVWQILKSDIPEENKKATIFDFDKVLGLELQKESEKEKKEKTQYPKEVTELLEKRARAREKKDWEKSDFLREKIRSLGFEVKDEKSGQVLEKI